MIALKRTYQVGYFKKERKSMKNRKEVVIEGRDDLVSSLKCYPCG
jgi:hypothetical protein